MKEILVALVRRLRTKAFEQRVEHEIYNRILAHLNKVKNCDYPFHDDVEMQRFIKAMKLAESLAAVERQIEELPAAYGAAFRYILHRDLRARLVEFQDLARRRVQPKEIDPRFIARAI